MANGTNTTDAPTFTETTMLDRVMALESGFYKPGPGYEFSNGRKFDEGKGPYGP